MKEEDLIETCADQQEHLQEQGRRIEHLENMQDLWIKERAELETEMARLKKVYQVVQNKVVILTEFKTPNGFFDVEQWKFSENCIAQYIFNKSSSDFRLFDGEQWISVPAEAFRLFLREMNARVS